MHVLRLSKLFQKCFNDMRKYILILQIVNLIFSLASCQDFHKYVSLKNNYVLPDSVFYEFDSIKHFRLIRMGGDIVDCQYPYFTDEFELLCRWKVYQCKDYSQMQQFKHKHLRSAVYVVKPDDTAFFSFDSERALKSEYNTVILDSIFENILDCGHLVPNLKNILDFLSHDAVNSQISPDSIFFYVMKFGDRFILPYDYEYNWELLPSKIQHGYNSGVAFCTNKPDYVYSWAIAW